mgnify:CR=1 FL=1|jgi:hypothetical protein
MIVRAEKPITKEQYDRAQLNNGFIPTEDMDKIFTTAEICGYGVYNPIARIQYGKDSDEVMYVVRYLTSNNCD